MNEKTPQKVVAPRRRLSLWWWLAAVVMVLVVLPILAHFYSTSEYFSPELIISKETTYITEPLTRRIAGLCRSAQSPPEPRGHPGKQRRGVTA